MVGDHGMTLVELLANSPIPGQALPITTLAAPVTTAPASGTIETWTFTSAPPAALQTAGGQYRFTVDSEICIDLTAGGGTSRQIQRGAEGTTTATHLSGASIYHGPTAGALQGALTAARAFVWATNPTLPGGGADPTGALDSTAALNAALALGPTFVPAGTYKILGVVSPPAGSPPVLIGAAPGAVTFVLGAAGQIAIGNRSGAGGIPVGGRVGNFTVNGNGVSSVAGGAFYVGLVTQVEFPNIIVKNGGADNCIIEGAQNNAFLNFGSFNATGSGLVLDYGCGENVFSGHTELYAAGRYNLEIRQSGTSPAGAYSIPQYNKIEQSAIEGNHGGPNSNIVNLGLIYHGAGVGNILDMCELATDYPAGHTASLVIVELMAGAAASAQFTFRDLTANGEFDNLLTCFDMRGLTTVVLEGVTTFAGNFLNAFETYNTDAIIVEGHIAYGTLVANQWAKNPASPTTSQALVMLSFIDGTLLGGAASLGSLSVTGGVTIGSAGSLSVQGSAAVTSLLATAAVALESTLLVQGAAEFDADFGAFGVSAAPQPTAAGTTAGFTAGTGTPVLAGSTSTGGVGTTAYTLGDIVAALKTLGWIKT